MTIQKEQVAITGNTYPVKEQLKALGARWNADLKAWMVSPEKADEAKKIVASAPAKQQSTSNGWRPGRRCYCAECGEPYRKGRTCWETGGFCTPEWE